jgi:hypothetical protein
VSVSPADFELYSRSTGTPLPRTPEERMRMAPEVHNFVRGQGYAKKTDIYRDVVRPAVRGLVLAGALRSAADAFGGNTAIPAPGAPPSSGPIDVSWTQVGETPPALPAGVERGSNVTPSPNPSPQMPSPGDNVGSVGTITKDLNTGAVPTSTFNVSGDGFNYNPGYYRQQADGLGSMAPINWPDASKNDPISFAVKTAGAVAGSGLQNAGTIATQGYYDLLKGGGDIKTGAQHAKTTIDGVYNWGASARQWHDNTLVPWHDNKLVPAVKSFANAPTNVFGVPIDNAHLSIRHPDVLPGERSHNVNHNIHRDVNRYPNEAEPQFNRFTGQYDEPGAPVSNVYENISAANLPTRSDAPSGLTRGGVPTGAIPSIRMGDIRANAEESASLSPKGDFIATDLALTEGDPVNYQWYGGQKPTQNVLNEAAANLRKKYADVYEAQGIMGDTLPANERIAGWQGQTVDGTEGLAGSASGVVNYEPAPDNTARLANVNGDQEVNEVVETLLPAKPNAGASVNTDPSATVVIDGREYPANSLQQVQAAGGRMYAMGPKDSGLVRGIVSYPDQGSPRSGTMDFYLRPYDKGPEAPANMYSYRVPRWVQRTINPLIDDGSLEQVLQEEYNTTPGAMYNRLLGRGSDVSPRYAGALAESGPYTLSYDFPRSGKAVYSEEFPSQLDALNASASMEGNPDRKAAIKGFQRRIKSGFDEHLADQYGAGSPEAVADALYVKKPGGRLMREVDNQALYDDYALHPRQLITGRPSKLGIEPDPWL